MRLTLEAMHSFPQRAVLTEDILCSQNPGDEYYAAQRTVARIQHQGEGFWPADGEKCLGPHLGRSHLC